MLARFLASFTGVLAAKLVMLDTTAALLWTRPRHLASVDVLSSSASGVRTGLWRCLVIFANRTDANIFGVFYRTPTKPGGSQRHE